MKELLDKEYDLLILRHHVLQNQAYQLPMPRDVSWPAPSSIANTGRLIQTLQQLYSATDQTKYANDPQYRSEIGAKEEAIIVDRFDLIYEMGGEGETAPTYTKNEYCTLAATIDTLKVIRDLYET